VDAGVAPAVPPPKRTFSREGDRMNKLRLDAEDLRVESFAA
jgi:hypothetical protein